MMALSSLNSKVTSQGDQLKRIENMLDKLISGSSVGEGQAEGRTKDGQVCMENNLCTCWPTRRYIPLLHRLPVVGLVLVEMREAMKEGHIMEIRYSMYITSYNYDMCTYQPSPHSCDGGVVHDDNQGFQPPLAKRSKVDPPPGPPPQVSQYT